MPYDPTKPANNSPIVSAELRNQFAGLKTLTDNLQAQVNDLPPLDTVVDLINANSAGPLGALSPPNFTISNPPTQAQVQAMADFMSELYVALSRT